MEKYSFVKIFSEVQFHARETLLKVNVIIYKKTNFHSSKIKVLYW